MNQSILNVVIYARVSSKEQYEEGYSIDSQLRLLREHAEKHNYRILKEYVDIETAKQSGRTNFGEMVRFLKESAETKNEKKHCRTILVEKTDRLYRNFRDYVTIDELDIDCHFVKDGQILSKDARSTEKFIHGIKVLMAKNYVDNLSEEAKKGMLEKARQGYWPSKAPLGYLNAEKDGKKVIILDPKLSPLIRKIYEWYSTDQFSIAECSKKAHEEGLVYPGSGAKVPASTVQRILQNPLYCGDIEWDGQFYRGLHEPIISRTLYHQVRLLMTNRAVRKPCRYIYNWAFVGLVTCGHCGANYTAEKKKGRLIYYRCTFSRQKCKERYVREELLAERFGEALTKIRLDKETLAWVLEALKSSHVDEAKYHEQTISTLQVEVRTLKDRLHAMYLDKLDGRIDAEFYDAKVREWNSQIQIHLEQIERHQSADSSYLEEGVKVFELVQNAAASYGKQDVFEQRKILNYVVSNASWKHGELTVNFKKPFDSLVLMVDEEAKKFQPGELEARRAEKWLGC